MSEEPEADRLRRETRELYDELKAKDLIEGSYEEWLADATKKAIALIDPKRIVVTDALGVETKQ